MFIFTQRLSNLSLQNLTTKCWPFAMEYLERCVDQWAPSCWAITVKCKEWGERKSWPTIYDLFQSVAQDAWQLPMLTLGATIVTRGFVERSRTEKLKDDETEKETSIWEQRKEKRDTFGKNKKRYFEGGIRTQISRRWYRSDPGVGPAEPQLSQAPHADSWKCQLQILWKFIAAEVSPQKILPHCRLARCSLAETVRAVPTLFCASALMKDLLKQRLLLDSFCFEAKRMWIRIAFWWRITSVHFVLAVPHKLLWCL